MRARVWVRTLDYLVESCWLLAIIAVPIFFDTMSTRIFEPDKIVLFRNIVLVMLVALFLRGLITLPGVMAHGARSAGADGASEGGDAPVGARRPGWRRAMARNPMLLPVIVFALIYTLATIHSVLPGISFWGSYDRMQGLYTWLSYIAFFFVLAYSIRSWAQVERVISAIVFASVPVAVYGIMQHLHWDPVQWGAPTDVRVASTLGNAIFIGAYLLMTMPFAAYRLWRAVERFRGSGPTPPAPMPAVAAGPAFKDAPRGRNGGGNGAGRGAGARATAPRPAPRPQQRGDTVTITGLPSITPVIGYALALMLSFAALYFCGSRGPYYGFLFAVVTMGILVTLKTSKPYPAMGALGLDIVLVAFPYIMNVLPPLVGLLLFVVDCALVIRFIKPYPALAAAGLVMAVLSFTPALDTLAPSAVAVASSTTGSSSSGADSAHLTSINDGDAKVRIFIWQGTIPLVLKDGIDKLLLGHGPETMIYVYSPFYPSGLGHLERANAAPDRNHDQWLDFIVFSGVFGLLAWLAVLAAFAYVLYKVARRPITTRAAIVLAAVAAVFIGNSVEASVGIPIVSTLMLLWTMFALAVVFYMRPGLSEGAPGVVAASAAVPAGAAAAVGAARPARRGQGATATAQRPAPRRTGTPQPIARPASFENLTARQQGGLLGFILLGLIGLVGAGLLFVNNIHVVSADVSYKTAQAYDGVGTACLQRALDPNAQGCPGALPTTKAQDILSAAGVQFIPPAINLYQDAINKQPGQDMYYLWQGKAYLDEAHYYLTLKQQADATVQDTKQPAQTRQAAAQQSGQALGSAVAQFRGAESVLKQAAALNPYNADHPMNLGRMYKFWTSFDPSQWKNADTYYQKATSLALHNGRWWDEWGTADMEQAQRPGVAPARQKELYQQALRTFNHACQVDDLLADARALRGDAYMRLGMYKEAADSYADALQVNKTYGFEAPYTIQAPYNYSAQRVLASLISARAQAKDYNALVRPIVAPETGQPLEGGSTPMSLAYSLLPAAGSPSTLAYSATSPYSLSASQFGASLQAISTTLRQKGLVK